MKKLQTHKLLLLESKFVKNEVLFVQCHCKTESDSQKLDAYQVKYTSYVGQSCSWNVPRLGPISGQSEQPIIEASE